MLRGMRGPSAHVERWTREFAVGVRVLRKDLGFTATAVLTLAVCLGGHAAIVVAVDAMLFHPLRVPEPNRVLLMANQYPRVEARNWRSATPDYEDRLRHVTVFEEQAFYNYTAATVDIGGVPARMPGMIATPSLFRLLRVNPARGRLFTDAEGTPGNDARVILTDGLWRELFGADPAAIGRSLRLNGRDRTIVGILPGDFSFADPAARFWIPLALTERERSDEARHRNGWISIGRLRPGATIAQAEAQLTAMDAANFERTPPRLQALLLKTGFYTSAEPLQDFLVRDVRRPLYLLWGAAVAVLVIGVANLATIALARSRARLGDLGTRLALGASRFDIVRQLVVESVLVGAAGAAGGFALATWMLTALRWAQPGSAALHVGAGAAAITLGLAVAIAVLMGLVSASPLLTLRLGTMMHEAHRSGTRGRAVRATWRALIVTQMTCSFALLMGSALLYVSLRNVLSVDPGFRTDDVISGFMSLSGPRYAPDAAARSFVHRALDSIRALPGVAAAGATTIVPMSGSAQTALVIAEGYVPAPGESPVSAVRSLVTPGYFEAVGTPLVRGRYFDLQDEDPASRHIVIDERLARRFWPDGSAVGRRVFCPMTSSEITTTGPSTPWVTVIGVVRNARLTGPLSEEGPSGTSGTYYLPYAVAAPRDIGYVVRAEREPAGIVREVRSALAVLDGELPLFDIRTLSERTGLALSSRTNTMHLAILFAGVGVFLSALGLYGMLAYLVTQRTREIGVRLAVGSTPQGIVALLLREGLALTVIGIAIGAAGSVACGRLLASYLYGVAASDPRMLLLMTAALAAVAILACIVPARRAAHIDVMRILSAP